MTPEDSDVTRAARRTFLAGSLGAVIGGTGVAVPVLALQKTQSDSSGDFASASLHNDATFVVEDFMGDDTDDRAWQRAIDAARGSSHPSVVVGTARRYRFSASVIVRDIDGLVIAGLGASTTIIEAADGVELDAVFIVPSGIGGSVRNLEVRDLGIDGGIRHASELIHPDDDSRSLTRAERQYSSGSIASGLQVHGDLADVDGAASRSGIVENIDVHSVRVYGTRGLPLFINGVRGYVSVRSCRFEFCLDVGFTFCESLVFSNNVVRWSADNGVSISRGMRNVTCVGNNIMGSYGNGIWLGGFAGGTSDTRSLPSAAGAETAVVAANSIVLSGANGIWLGGGAQQTTLTGNHVAKVIRRASDLDATLGEAQLTSESWMRSGNGVFVAEYPETNDQKAVLARDIAITGNTFVDCVRGGVLVRGGARTISVLGNTILRPGAAIAPNGEVFSGAQGFSNYGVSIPGGSSSDLQSGVANVMIAGNVIIDDREAERTIGGKAVPVMEYATYVNPGARGCAVSGNLAVGARRKQPEDGATVQILTDDERKAPEDVATGALRLDAANGRLMVSDGTRWRSFEPLDG